MAPFQALQPLQPLRSGDPERVGSHRLLARLGAGGMGVVYLGRSPGGRLVAVKVIRRRFTDAPDYRARFRREVEAARRVTGTFTAPVVDADPDAPDPWLATVYLPGLTLREAVTAHGRMPPDTVRALAGGLAEALAAIHRAGVVHRDLKPANVILTAGGPRVIDFGIARPEDGTAVTRAGAAVGTPGFMAPEQVAGKEVGPPADVFTLGAVLAYAASGTEPFGQGPARSRQYRIVTGAADLSGVDDPWLHDLITDCLRHDPAERPAAAAVLARLDGADGTSAEGTSAQETSREMVQGTRWLPAALAEEIDRRTAESRGLALGEPGGSEEEQRVGAAVAAQPRPGGGVPVADAPASGLFAETAEPEVPGRLVETADPAEAAKPTAVSRRWVIAAGAAGGVLATGGAVALLLGRDDSRGGRQPVARAGGTPSASASPDTPPPRAAERWKVKVSDYYPDLMTAGGLVLVKNDEGRFHALDPRTGRTVWKRRALNASNVAGDVAYLIDSTTWDLSAVRASTGRTLWKHDLPFGVLPIPGPAVTGAVVCFGESDDTQVRALGVRDGRARWTARASAEYGIAAGDGVVIAVGKKKAVGLNASTGRTVWSRTLDEGRYPHFADGLFFVADRHATLHALRAADGEAAWRRPRSGYGNLLQSGGGLVFTDAGDGLVQALRTATGEPVWTRRLGRGEGGSYGRGNVLGLSGGTLHVGCTDRNVYALDPATGRVRWTFPADMTLRSGPVAAGGLSFVATRDGHVRALVPPTGIGGTSAAP